MASTTSRLIQNPILNSPFREPTRHFTFTEDGITDRIVEGRRKSSYFILNLAERVGASVAQSIPGERSP